MKKAGQCTILSLLFALFIFLVSCEKDVEGHYLGENDYFRIDRNGEDYMLTIFDYSHQSDQLTPYFSARLVKNNYGFHVANVSGEPIVVTQTEYGISVRINNLEKRAVTFNPFFGKSDITRAEIDELVKKDFFAVIDNDRKSSSQMCGSYGMSERKRAHLKELIERGELLIRRDTLAKTEGKLFDTYEVEGYIHFPIVSTDIYGEDICVAFDTEMGKKLNLAAEKLPCHKKRKAHLMLFTQDYDMAVKLKIYKSRFNHIQHRENRIDIVEIDHKNVGSAKVQRLFCNNFFMNQMKLAYNEQLVSFENNFAKK